MTTITTTTGNDNVENRRAIVATLAEGRFDMLRQVEEDTGVPWLEAALEAIASSW
jgi:hypothetical protein